MKAKTFAEKIKTKFNKLVSHLRKKYESGKSSGGFTKYTIKDNGIEAEISEGQLLFRREYIGIYVRFTANNEYLFTAEFKLENDSVEEIEKIIKKEMTRRKNELSNVINALNDCLN